MSPIFRITPLLAHILSDSTLQRLRFGASGVSCFGSAGSLIGESFLPEGPMQMAPKVGIAVLVLSMAGAAPLQNTAPTAEDIFITVEPGGTACIPYSGFDAESDQLGFKPISGPTPPELGTLLSVCSLINVAAGSGQGDQVGGPSLGTGAGTGTGGGTGTEPALSPTARAATPRLMQRESSPSNTLPPMAWRRRRRPP